MGKAFLERIKAPKRPDHGSFDDWLLDRELEACCTKQNGGNGVTEKFCSCAELVIDNDRQPCPPRHDCQYVVLRSALVPEAEKIANERVVVCLASEDGGASQALWVRHFASEMERLSRPLLNGASSKQAA